MKKKVDVFCAKAFTIGAANFAGRCLGIVLDVETIRICLFNKALVWELTNDGKRIALDLSNYRKDNGGVVESDTTTANDETNRSTKVTKISFKETKTLDQEVKKENVVAEVEAKAEVVEDKTAHNNNQQQNQKNNNKFKNSKA
nr:MAG TPA: hypothetical protein [Caudoviricetes sp.]